MAIADYVLDTDDHPSADQVFARVRKSFPAISRATVYNTLNRFVREGLLRTLILAEGRVVFDPKVEPHHHFIDEGTGRIHDVPWHSLRVSRVDALDGLDVREYQVVMRGRHRSRRG
jgi:Fe2+ or Zn2+ uptake regulation protein